MSSLMLVLKTVFVLHYMKHVHVHETCTCTCPDYRGVLISQVHLYTFILSQLTVLIIEVSIFQSVLNNRFDSTWLHSS